MRHNVLSKHSTKPERIVYEVLKEMHIPFKHRWLIAGHEVDFVLWGRIALEIDGHPQVGDKNHLLVEHGLIPIHLTNEEVTRENITQLLRQL